jgi:transcriptional regulator
MTTVELLEKVQAEALRLRTENKRLASELSVARKRVTALEKRAKPRRKTAESVVDTVDTGAPPPEKKAGPKRQALGAGLAQFLGARRPG